MLQLSVTALFYLEDSRKIHLQGVRARWSKDTRRAPQRTGEREKELALALLFICFSLPGPVLCKLGQPGGLFVLPEVLTLVLRPFLFYFHELFPSLSFSHRHFGLFFPILPPNIPPSRDGRPITLGIGASRSFWLLPAQMGWRGVLGLPLLLVSSLRVLIAVSI